MGSWPANEKEFLKWFWEGSNGNDLIKKLNVQDNKSDYIRREKCRPTIYCLVLNNTGFLPKKDGDEWKLCKVGFTHVSTVEDSKNRMETVMEEIKKKSVQAKGSVLFVLPIGALDTTRYFETETRIRQLVGKPVKKEEAKKMNLHCPTEWVLTTQAHIDCIKKTIGKNPCTTDIFKSIMLVLPELPDEVKDLVR